MIHSLPPYILYLLTIAGSFIISVYAVRKIIFITKHRKIYDIPDNTRKIHGAQIPSLGGIGIFVGYILVAAFFMFMDKSRWNYVLISSVILFFTGIYDDLMNMRPLKKLLAQLIASAITVYFTLLPSLPADYLPLVNTIPYWLVFTAITLFCTFFINAFNFIDGIDGLACVLAILYTILLGVLFACMLQVSIAGIIFSLAGAAMGLLYYNKSPAKIYMGDTGSMLLGFNVFIFSILFISLFRSEGAFTNIGRFVYSPNASLSIAGSVLFLPAYDAIRVFILRVSKGISPLKADRTHLHYYLLDAGFTHLQSVIVILVTNLFFIGLAFLLQDLNPLLMLLIFIFAATAVLFVIYRLRQKNLQKRANF